MTTPPTAPETPEPPPPVSWDSGAGTNGAATPGAARSKLLLFVFCCIIGLMFVWFAWRGMRGWQGRPSSDMLHFYWAAEAMWQGKDIHASGTGGYLYPPLLAFVLIPLTALSLNGAAGVWITVSLLGVLTAVFVGAREMCRRFRVEPKPELIAGAMAFACALMIDKIRWQMELQQVDTITLLAMLLGLVWLERRPALCGAVIGFAVNIKYYAIIALPYMILRGRWRAAAWTLAWTVGWALLPATVMGWRGNLEALRHALGGVAKVVGVETGAPAANIAGDATWIQSVSLTSAAARAVQGVPHEKALWLGSVGAGALACVGVAWGMYRSQGMPLWRGRFGNAEDRPDRADIVGVEWLGLVTAVLVFSPQTVIRQTLPALLVYVAASVLALAPPLSTGRKVARWPLIAGLATFTLGAWLPPGGAGFDGVQHWWRSVGGACWCLLVLFFTLMWTVLARRKSQGLQASLD